MLNLNCLNLSLSVVPGTLMVNSQNMFLKLTTYF